MNRRDHHHSRLRVVHVLGPVTTSSSGSPGGASDPSGLTARAVHPGRRMPPLPSVPILRSMGGKVTAVHVSVMPYAWPIRHAGRTCTRCVVSSEESGAAPLIRCRTELRCLQSRTTMGGTRLPGGSEVDQ